MPSYRRFVTYLFQYEHAVKTRNCGFAKVEIRQGQCRMEIQVKGVPDGSATVYLFTGREKGFYGVPVGNLGIRNGAGSGIFSFSTAPVGDTGWQMEDMSGICIRGTGENFAASQWKDEDLDWNNFRIYEKKTEDPGDQAEAKPLRQPEETVDEGRQAEAVREKKQDLQAETVREKKQDVQAETVREKKQNRQPEIHATQTAAGAVREENGSCPDLCVGAWEKQWRRFSAVHPVFCPFDEAQDIFAVKMDLRDFKFLPKEYLSLANNSFLLHGYFNYKYFLFGYMEGEKRKWFLGVPGFFQNQEQLLAGMFGFGEFRTRHATKQKTGEFGYWYRILEI